MDRALQTDDVNLAGLVFAERRDHYVGVKQRIKRRAVPQKNLAAAVIAEDVVAGGERICRPTIGVTANHRAAPFRKMIVVEDRRDVIARHARVRAHPRATSALKNPPSAIAPMGDDVNLFDHTQPDVTGVKSSVGAVERTPPWIAKPQRIDFIASRRRTEERIGRGHGVWLTTTRVNINAQYLAHQRVFVLRLIVGVIPRASVSRRDVEIAVGAE